VWAKCTPPCLCACGNVSATSKAAGVGGIRRRRVCLGMMMQRVNDGKGGSISSPSCSNGHDKTWGSRKDGEGGSNPSPSCSNGCKKT